MLAPAAELADLISAARDSGSPLRADRPPWPDLDERTAHEVAELLYQRWGAAGSSYWKLGAIDEVTQRRLGVSGPVAAPVAPDRVLLGGQPVRLELSSFLHAKFEAEVGVAPGDHPRVVPCIEIADSRFAGWALPPNGLIADACLQSMLLFGEPAEPQELVSVAVRHDGVTVAAGEQEWQPVLDRLTVLPAGSGASRVATGSMIDLLDVKIGTWDFDFGPYLGIMSVEVV